MAKKFICSQTGPIVQTKAGKLRGLKLDSTYIFQGIKYADAKRFQMPQPVKPWEGVKDALSYGYVCPLMTQEVPNGETLVPHRYWLMDENCQYLNIWTQTLDKDAKKPVMVWLHGGGFYAGSSIEHVSYDGENMSKYGDVVVVSLNHRLNVLGYMNLEDYGEKYKNSANAGNADMVAALKWVHENIAAFGGDPENVTIFGQSGGGMKVWTLMQTPEADGLFQKGIIQSGVMDEFMDTPKTDGRPIVEAMLKELGFEAGDVEKLETVPYPALAAAYQKVGPKLAEAGEYVGGVPMANDFYVGDPREVGFTEHAKTIPVMIGTVFGEFAFGPGIESKYELPEKDVLEMLHDKYGEAADTLVPLYRKAYPDKALTDLLFLDALFRNPTIDFVQKKAVHTQAPTYSYMFAFEFPYDNGKIAWHCSEIPFVFKNTDKVPVCNVPGVSDKLEDQMFGAWIAFARYGNPNVPSLPQWPASTADDEAVMILDRTCEVRHNYDHELIHALIQANPQMPGDSSEDEVMLH